MKLQDFDANQGFEAPSYNIESPGNFPDFRQLLYWNPAIDFPGGHFLLPEFYASDHSGNYIIRVEGITDSGIPLRVTTTINVTA